MPSLDVRAYIEPVWEFARDQFGADPFAGTVRLRAHGSAARVHKLCSPDVQSAVAPDACLAKAGLEVSLVFPGYYYRAHSGSGIEFFTAPEAARLVEAACTTPQV